MEQQVGVMVVVAVLSALEPAQADCCWPEVVARRVMFRGLESAAGEVQVTVARPLDLPQMMAAAM